MTGRLEDIGGMIRVRLSVAKGKVVGVSCVSTRPVDAAAVFVGRDPADVVAQIGSIYALCGRAQSAASLGAFEEAFGLQIAPAQSIARDILRLAEMLTQTAMRLCLHWPKALGLEPVPAIVRGCLALEAALEADFFDGPDWKIIGGTPVKPASPGTLSLLEGMMRQIRDLFAPGDLADSLRQELEWYHLEGFGALTLGEPLEHGALMRKWDHPEVAWIRRSFGSGLATRLEAGLCELRELVEAIVELEAMLQPDPGQPACDLQKGRGQATVETARGPLTHAVQVENGRIVAYSITAPTEANFAPDGVIEHGILGAEAKDRVNLQMAARLLVLAVDPCVAYDVEIRDA